MEAGIFSTESDWQAFESCGGAGVEVVHLQRNVKTSPRSVDRTGGPA
jgi:hypothetical protein